MLLKRNVTKPMSHSRLQEDTPTPFPHAIHRPSTPLTRNRDISPPSGLSSPFVDRRTPASAMTPRRSSSNGPDSPMGVDDFSPGSSRSNRLPSLRAPVPQRPVGGEIHRIRLQAEADQAARLQETEFRRPDYLKRTKRPLPDFDFDAFEPMQQDSNLPNLGVTESPIKGRRLTLFQETSEESFEQSLLAGGYPRYGLLPGYEARYTTLSKNNPGVSQHTLNWLQHSTPAHPTSSRHSAEPNHNWSPNEQEMRKRRRLAAFESASSSGVHSRLYVVEVEGRGRVLLDCLPSDVDTRSESPVRQRPFRSRKRKVRGSSGHTSKKDHMADINQGDQEAAKPNWPDSEYPWSVRMEEREELERKDREEKMRWIERFLDRDSDEEEDEEDQPFGSGVPAPDDANSLPPRPGRGKMVPLKSHPETRTRRAPDRFMIPSDPADARAALLSKRSVRALSFRRRQEALMNVEPEVDDGMVEDEVVCICRGRDDGRELVQCDDCHVWYHLECIGIGNVEDLGKEDDPWYCSDCLDLMATPSSDLISEPTFVPTDDRPSSANIRDPLFFQGSFQESPAAPWTTPRTPIQSSDDHSADSYPSSRSYGDSSRVGPTTPSSGSATRSTHAYRTPTIFEGVHSDEFDPTSTPSRGIKFGGGSFTTPKTTNIWPTRDGLIHTPRRGRDSLKLSGGRMPLLFDFSGGAGTGSGMPPRTVYSYEDTPVRRSHPREERSYAPLKRLLDSPLGQKSTALPFFGREGSPSLEASRRIQRIRNRKSAPALVPEN